MKLRFKKPFVRIITLVLFISMMVGTIPSAFAAWDGYAAKDGEVSTQKILLNMNNAGAIYQAGAVASRTNVKSGMYSAHWADHVGVGVINFTNVERDWSDCDSITFDVYSECVTNGKIAMMVYCDYVPAPGKTMSYQQKTFTIDWTGWKTFTWSLDEFTVGNQADFAKVNRVEFIANGWGCAPYEESELYIGSVIGNISASDGEEVTSGVGVTAAEKSAVFEALGNSVAVCNFSANMLKDGKVSEYGDAQITTANGVSMAPLEFFEKGLGITTQQSGEEIKLTKADKTLTISSDKVSYILGSDKGKLDAEVISEETTVYLPLTQIAGLLGYNAVTKDMVTVVGDVKSVLAFKENSSLAEYAKIMLANAGQSKVTEEDWKEVKDRWRRYIVGDENTDITNEYVKDTLVQIDKACKSAWGQINRGKDATVLFGTRPVTATADMNTQYAYMESMAVAYGSYGSSYYQNKKLRSDILYSLNWLYNHYYGQAEIDGTGWRSTKLFNWSDWYVTTPGSMMRTILIMENYLSQAKIEKYLSLYEHLRGEMRTRKTSDEAASRIYNGTLAAVLLKDEERMRAMTEDYNLLLIPSKSGLGVQEDWLYLTHNNLPYTSAYGTGSLLNRIVVVESILKGTAFEFTSPYKYNSCIWMYEMFEPILFNSGLMSSFAGRAPGMEQVYGSYVTGAAVNLLGVFGRDDDIRLKQIIKRSANESVRSVLVNYLDISQLSDLTRIMNDESIEIEDYNRAKVYYTGDRVVLQRKDFAIALSMSSSRIPKYESLNGVHMDGWYTGDGMVYTYIKGDNNAFNSVYWKQANPYHRAGTTVDTQEREAVSVKFGKEYFSSQDFVGAVEFDKMYATAAMQHEDFTNLVKGTTSTDEYGGDLEVHESSLVGKKAWFMFDDEVVALGADINASDGFDVHTVLENRKLNKEETVTNVEASQNMPYEIASVSASGDDGNVPENVTDSDYNTRWSLEGTVGSYLVLELPKVSPIGYVGIAQYNGTGGKQAIFDLEVSTDGVNWEVVDSFKASGTTVSMEPYNMKGVNAKYVRYNGHGRTNSSWNSVTEIKVFPPSKDGSMVVDGQLTSNKRLGMENIIVDGVLMEKTNTYEKSFDNPKWVHIENVGGYVLPKGGKLSMAKTADTVSCIEFWLEHGVNPQKAEYAYIMLPTKGAEETKAYSESNDIEILANSEKLQAVREKSLGVTGMVFWQGGTFENITVSEGAIVMQQEKDGILTVSISDPTQKLASAVLTVDTAGEIIEKDARMSVESENGKQKITIDFAGSKGRTLTIRIKK